MQWNIFDLCTGEYDVRRLVNNLRLDAHLYSNSKMTAQASYART